MNCHEAQALLTAGVQPRGTHARYADLGFHLVACPGCRAYRERLDSAAEQLLTRLLTKPIVPEPSTTPPPPAEQFLADLLHMPVPAAGAIAPQAQRRALRYTLAGICILILIFATVPVIRAALAVQTIRQNVQAMIVPPQPDAITVSQPPAARSSRPPAAPMPTQPPAASRSDQDSAVPLEPPLLAPAQLLLARDPAPPPGEAVNILILGSDQRLGEHGPSRADAIMVARIDPQRHRVALLSLTRDLLVEIPGHGWARINTANVYGGPELMRQTVSNFLQIPIHYYVYVNFEGFITAVDALGGITVNVHKEVYQWGWELHFLPGPQPMDGLTALRYSRIRLPDSDYDRIQRQQAVLLGIATRLRERNVLGSLEDIAELSTALRGYIQTDLPEERMLGLAWALRNFPLEAVERYTLEGSMVSTNVIPGDRYAQVVNPGVIETLTRQLLGPDAP